MDRSGRKSVIFMNGMKWNVSVGLITCISLSLYDLLKKDGSGRAPRIDFGGYRV